MPGPTNGRKRNQNKRQKKLLKEIAALSQSVSQNAPAPVELDTAHADQSHEQDNADSTLEQGGEPVFESSSGVESRWNGPRVMDIPAFLDSKYATPPSLDDPICAEYNSRAIKEALRKNLPLEIALILWYNRSRAKARICPSCHRFYNIDEPLAAHVQGNTQEVEDMEDPRNQSEKEITGICSLLCFGIVSYSWPGCIGAWGKRYPDIDERTRAKLNKRVEPEPNEEGLGVFLRISRMADEDLLPVLQSMYDSGVNMYSN
ncbi:hypothetical protein M422DRAFT_255000 [Sphaerobolus stellatus SS14]|uniref:Unplaced genomic scaffold SPHSTscaffold_58, whole genome shotgun sequence n=1 Tax=Sphaerobolus stellatus (strain SS14) TaxID=990650 RepID=A0A0C9UZY9_SPHS4|nr:hypothetical protein M422DRAFT_262851 [Sphaerobolus stellatus SS14]KIJ41979.1 hypothetical protein M422DRAFT_255000 [Sphaerobolus stellatus SS14]